MDAALLILRLTVGLLVAAHGSQKLFGWFEGHGLRRTSALLESQGFRPATLWTLLGATAEFGGGLLFALGLGSPLGAIGIGSAMLVAITKIHWPKVWAASGGFEYPLVMLAAAVAVGIAGPGAYSLDAAWGTSLPTNVSQIVVGLAALGYLAGMIHSASAARKNSSARPSGEARTR